MIFLYALPILSGFIKLSVATVARFPRHGISAAQRIVVLDLPVFGSIHLRSFLAGHTPDAGWFNYTPYTLRDYDPGRGMDIYALGMVFLGISTTVGSINFIVTFLRTKATGMSINRLPIMIWGTLTASVGNLFAVPAVSLAFFMLWTDRQLGTHFFDPPGAAIRFCGSTFSGCSAIHGSMQSYCPRWASSRTQSRCLPPTAGRLYARRVGDSGDHVHRLRRLGAPYVCDGTAAPVAVVLQRRFHRYRDP